MSPEPLHSWREPSREAVDLEFVAAVTDRDSPDFVAEPDRVAVFDNDGTLWTEQPLYAQLAFAFDRAAELGHPMSLEELQAGGMDALTDLIGLTHAGITTDEFDVLCRSWLASARHPRFGRPYPQTCTSRCSSCSTIWTATASPAGSSPAAAPTSCGPGQPTSTACRPHRVIGSVGETEFRLGDARSGTRQDTPPSRYSMTGRRSPARSTGTSGSAPSSPPATLTATWPCSSGPPRARTGPCSWSFTTRTASASTPTTATLSSAAGIEQLLAAAAEHKWTVIDMATDWSVVYPPH